MAMTSVLNEHFSTSFFNSGPMCQAFSQSPALKAICDDLPRTHPHLFSPTPLFVSPQDVKTIQSVVTLIEKIVKIPAYQRRALSGLDAIAAFAPQCEGVFFGYDFHMGEDGPKLIEINTNAGGAYLNWVLLEAQRACCDDVTPLMHEPVPHKDLPQNWVEMFQSLAPELRHIAIIDENPSEQYLYPEFLLFAAAFEKAGVKVSIADPSDCIYENNRLMINGAPVDFIYNRLTDFYLNTPQTAAIRKAYLMGEVGLSPTPQHHALFAHKRNLIPLSDPNFLAEIGLSQDEIDLLGHTIPRTELVTSDTAEALWKNRNKLFFKPVSGFGSRATYRGDKVTKSVWEDIVASDYVAQALVRPSLRKSADTELKYDLRAYVNGGKVELLAGRLYQGQTTNFRTQGGGFAPVYLAPDVADTCCLSIPHSDNDQPSHNQTDHLPA